MARKAAKKTQQSQKPAPTDQKAPVAEPLDLPEPEPAPIEKPVPQKPVPASAPVSAPPPPVAKKSVPAAWPKSAPAAPAKPIKQTAMAPANRARQLWVAFEQWSRPRHDAVEKELSDLFATMNGLRTSVPKHLRETELAFQAKKDSNRRDREAVHFEEMRNEWGQRLSEAGLEFEDWNDIKPEEQITVMRVLGADAEVEEDTVVLSAADIVTESTPSPVPQQAAPPSSYNFVNPTAFHSDDEDEGDEAGFDLFEMTSSFNDDSNSDASATTNNWAWESEFSGYTTWNTETPQSSSHSSPKSSPGVALGDFVKIPAAAPPPRSHSAATVKATEKKKKSRYVGPALTDLDDGHDDEADFAEFKKQTRIRMIREFHAEAAEFDIYLASEIDENRGSLNKSEVAEMLSQHEDRIVMLRETKEEERKAVVDAERQKRKKEIRARSSKRTAAAVDVTPRPSLAGESLELPGMTQQLLHELEKDSKPTASKKKKVGKVAPTAPPPAPVKSTPTSMPAASKPAGSEIASGFNYFDYDVKSLLANIPESSLGVKPALFTRPTFTSASSSSSSSVKPSTSSAFKVQPPASQEHEFWMPSGSPAAWPAMDEYSAPAYVPPKAQPLTSRSNSEHEIWHPSLSSRATETAPAKAKSIETRSSTTNVPKVKAKVSPQSTPFPSSIDPMIPPEPTLGATSSRTTLDQMRMSEKPQVWRPPVSASASVQTQQRPPTVAPQHEIWLPGKQSETGSRMRTMSGVSRRPDLPVPVPSPQIKKVQSMPQERAESHGARNRRMSDPVSPGPRTLNFEDIPSAPAGILKKGKASVKGKGKRVTVEEIPDEESVPFERLPSNSAYIMEPRPVMAPAMFDDIFNYDESYAAKMVPGWEELMAEKTKHVRWTPSVTGGSDTSSITQWPAPASRKGKAKTVENDDLSRFAQEAMDKLMAKTPASAM
ncbi:hypothetical protein C8J56DRAFT_834759 [Mycena floridula]|nr:hypothetical protein C8J56DRAFT_834759 [Mycena floridula]